MNILVLNIGSSSIKYDLFKDDEILLKGNIERVKSYEKAIKQVISEIETKGLHVDAVGHRVVHGGEHEEPQVVTKENIKQFYPLKELAPLHDVPELKGMEICMKLFSVPQVAVFDTAFHQTMPEKAYTYAIPAELVQKYKIRRYGFHGTSHKYVCHEAAKMLGKPLEQLKIISCHLGSGCSICAVKHGKSFDTSMGFTPLEGLVMGTRSGDIDAAIIPFLEHKEKLKYKQIEEMLNKKSGLLGMCGKTDMRDIHNDMTDPRAKLAEEVFCYRITKYIGAYIAAMNGVDAILFTGGIGENAYWIRKEILSNFSHIGIKLNENANKENKRKISAFTSRIKVLVVPTNEELMIAREARKIIAK
jgi:acetate kinase